MSHTLFLIFKSGRRWVRLEQIHHIVHRLKFWSILIVLSSFNSSSQNTSPQYGVASYYGKEFHGRTTSNGEKFSMYSMTAAHQTLPYNTKVKVTNLLNKKSVIVRINDAGPFHDNRIIDLSKAAAIKLDMIKDGTTRVRIDILAQDTTRNDFYDMNLKKLDLSGYAIQIGSYSNYSNAIRNLKRLKAETSQNVYLQIVQVHKKKIHRVVIGGFPTRERAEQYLLTLTQKGKKGMVFQIR